MKFCLRAVNYVALVAALACLADPVDTAALGVVQTTDANLLASTVLAAGTALVPNTANVTSHTLPSDIKFCAATFTDNGNGTSMTSGVALSTGWVGDLVDPNDNQYVGVLAFGTSASLPDGATGLDPCYLKFTFQCPSWATSVQVQYVFASEDYGYRSAGNSFSFVSDEMFILLNGNALNNNIATVPGTNTTVSSLSINANTNSQYFRDNSQSTLAVQANGLTQILTATGNAKSGGINTIEFIVADIYDTSKDSWLLIKPGSLTCLGCPTTDIIPTLTAVASYQVGDTYTLALSVGYAPVKVNWGDGTTEDALMTHQYTNAGTFTITVTSKYSDPRCPVKSFNNSIQQTVNARSCTYPTVTNSTRVGTNATIYTSSLTGGYYVSIDWQTGEVVTAGTKTAYSTLLNEEKLYDVKVTFSDGKGCSKDTFVPIAYCTSAPSPSYSSTSVAEGSNLTVSISSSTGYLASVNWGDAYANSTGATSLSHSYDDNSGSPYTVKVRVYNPTTGCFADTNKSVTVNNTAPTIQVSGPSKASINATVTVYVTCNDAGTKDSQTLLLNWGDGTRDSKSIDFPASTYCQNVTFTHEYRAAATYRVTATAMDKDSASKEAIMLIAVVAPTKSPTKAPTKIPTKAPTKLPTKAPTKLPTKAPTKLPTKAPTGSSPTGLAPTGSSPTGSSPTLSSPTGSSPTGSSPTGTSPTVSSPTGSSPTVTAPTASAPTASAPTSSTVPIVANYTYNMYAEIKASGSYTGPNSVSTTFSIDLSYGGNKASPQGAYPSGVLQVDTGSRNYLLNVGRNDNYLFQHNSLYVVSVDTNTKEGGVLYVSDTTRAYVQVRQTGTSNSIKVNMWTVSGSTVTSTYAMPNFVAATGSATLTNTPPRLLRGINIDQDKDE